MSEVEVLVSKEEIEAGTVEILEEENGATPYKPNIGVTYEGVFSNVVDKTTLRKEQAKAINYLADVVMHTFGPMESNTMMILSAASAGINNPGPETTVKKYSKDGHTVLSKVRFVDPIHTAIQSELLDITSYAEREVGDGTTSAMEIARFIFNNLCKIEDEAKYQPYEIIRSFSRVVSSIKEYIYKDGREIEKGDIYDICMISTNGNEEIAKSIADVYEKYGYDAYIDVVPGRDKEDQIKEYNGMTVNVPYADVAYVNGGDGAATLTESRVYYFIDPIDNRELCSLFEKIIMDNILEPFTRMQQGDMDAEYIPTTIIAPVISRDMSALMEQVVQIMYSYDNQKASSQKPPLLIITNLGPYQDQIYDICRLCGCKGITKYIDDEAKKADQDAGRTPTLENVSTDFYGTCGFIEAGATKTKFINPKFMYEYDKDGNARQDEEGNFITSNKFKEILRTLEGELINAQNSSADANVLGNLKRRINSLKGNMIDYIVGGISQQDRDSKRDLIEDSVLSCRSAAKSGIGFAANYEGLLGSNAVYKSIENANKAKIKNGDALTTEEELDEIMAGIIYLAYYEVQRELYGTYTSNAEEVDNIIIAGLEKYGNPFNLRTKKYDGKVITSIDTDPTILDAISQIILLMFTANQALLPSAVGNKYLNATNNK